MFYFKWNDKKYLILGRISFFFLNFKKRKKKLTSDRYPTSKSVLFECKKKYPNKIPTIPKSESPNVVPSNPSEPRTGSKSAGKKEIKIPLANAPKMAPHLSPVALLNTPAAALVKKCGISLGTISFKPTSGKINIEIIPAAKLDKKPTMMTFGAYRNNSRTIERRFGVSYHTKFIDMLLR